MQMVFAYKQRTQANFLLSEDKLKEMFSPDLNSMEFQDTVLLDQRKKDALELLHKLLEGEKVEGAEDIVETAVKEAIDQFNKKNLEDIRQIRKQMVEDVDHIYDSYVSFLELLLELHFKAEQDTKRDHSNFVKNLLIKGLKLNKSVEKAILKHGFGWQSKPEVKEWLRTIIAQDEVYQEYNKKTSTFSDDQEILRHLVGKIIFKNDVIETFLEESDLYWDENRPVVKSLLLKTLKSIPESDPSDFDLQEVSYNFDEDKEFFVKLYDSTIDLPVELSKLIAEKALNWDIERLALTDRVILEMAIAELTNFPSIPVKVTINEYIEVSKKYSTPKSKQFINGLLDVIANELKNKGAVKKSGRGLIDNK